MIIMLSAHRPGFKCASSSKSNPASTEPAALLWLLGLASVLSPTPRPLQYAQHSHPGHPAPTPTELCYCTRAGGPVMTAPLCALTSKRRENGSPVWLLDLKTMSLSLRQQSYRKSRNSGAHIFTRSENLCSVYYQDGFRKGTGIWRMRQPISICSQDSNFATICRVYFLTAKQCQSALGMNFHGCCYCHRHLRHLLLLLG